MSKKPVKETPIPHDLDIEVSLINSLLTKNDLFFQIHDKISELDFLNEENKQAFNIIKNYILSSKPIDITILKSKLDDDSVLKDKLCLENKTANEVKEYANSLVDKRIRRDLIFTSGEIMQESMRAEGNASDILDKFRTKIANIRNYDDTFIPNSLKTLCSEHSELMVARKNKTEGISTGIPDLDRYLNGGFKKGDMISIGARPSVGKTSLAVQLALAAARNGKKSIFVSAEMSKEDIMDKCVASFGEFNPYDILVGNVNPKILNNIYTELSRYDLKILELINGTSKHIISAVTKESMLHGVDIIFVDYIQLLRDYENKLNETVRVGIITKNLKALARELKIPVVILSQLNRNPEHRTENIPTLSDLRSSGDIEQDSDVVLLIHRQRNNVMTFQTNTNLFIAKNRKGETGRIQLKFDPKTLTFSPYGTASEDISYGDIEV